MTRSTSRVDVLGGQVRGARTWRWASARTCQTCQVARRACSVVADPVARCRRDPRGIDRGAGAARRAGRAAADHRATALRRRRGPPRLRSRQVVRCSARVRGSCLASRVSRVACWARWIASTGRGRPWSRLERGGQLAAAGLDAGPPGRPALVQGGSTPTTSRTGRLPRSVPGTLGETQPEAGPQVLLQGGVVGLGGGDVGLEQDPPVDRQPLPGQGLDLVGDRDVGVQVGVAGAGVAVGERGRDQPGDVDLAHPVRALPGEQGVLLDERQRVGDGRVVGPFDLRGDVRRGDRPQGADRLHRGEGQVVPGDRGGPRPGQLGDRRRTARGRRGVPAVLGAEELGGDLGADPRPVLRPGPGSRAGAPATAAWSSIRLATSTWNAVTSAGVDLERVPRAGSPPCRSALASGPGPASALARAAAARGCRPAPNRACICCAVTSSPTLRPSMPAIPEPTQLPGVSPRSV